MSDPDRPEKVSSTRLFRDDTKFALGRIAVFQYTAVAVFLFLIAGFWVLQIRDHEANSTLAERNRIKTVPLLAPRGAGLRHGMEGQSAAQHCAELLALIARQPAQFSRHGELVRAFG